MPTAMGQNQGGRPMTSVRAAGYSSRGRTAVPGALQGYESFATAGKAYHVNEACRYFRSLFWRLIGRVTPEKIVLSPENQIKTLETKIMEIVHESCILASQLEFRNALERAKEAAKKERQLAHQKESNNMADQITLDLTYTVLFNLASQYHSCKMYQEALNTYSVIVKNKTFNQSGRLRVNMGNIYFEQQNYAQAVKMYRMALDQIPTANMSIRYYSK